MNRERSKDISESPLSRIIPLILLGAVLIFGVNLRFDRLWKNSLTYDECVWGNVATNWLEHDHARRNFRCDDLFVEQPPLWWFMVGGSLKAFGQSKFGLRFPALFCGVILILIVYLLVRELVRQRDLNGWLGPMTSALLISMNPVLVYFSRTGQIEQGVMASGLLGVLLATYGRRRRGSVYCVLAGISIVMAVMVKYLGLLFLPVALFVLVGRSPDNNTENPFRKVLAKRLSLFAGGLTIGFCGAVGLCAYLFGADQVITFFTESIVFPVRRVMHESGGNASWRSLPVKEFLDRVYGWFHPLPLLAVILFLGDAGAAVIRRFKRLRDPELTRSTASGPSMVFFCVGIFWILFLSAASEASRNYCYASIVMPLLAVYCGLHLQRIASLFPDTKNSPATRDYFQRSSSAQSPQMRFVYLYGPGIILVIFLVFLQSSFQFSNRMFKEEWRRNYVSLDPSEVIGRFVEFRCPDAGWFLCVRNGPQISFVSSRRYDQLYGIFDKSVFRSVLEASPIFVENGSLDHLGDRETITKELRRTRFSGPIYRYIFYYQKKTCFSGTSSSNDRD